MSFNRDWVASRSPRLRAILNGTVIIAPIGATVAHSASRAAATFALSVSLVDNADLNATFWASLNQARVKIQISPDTLEPYIDLIEGYCDSIRLHPISGFVRIEGRDLSASLLDTKTPTDFQNRTPTEIATSLATSHGLTPMMGNAAAITGRYYGGTNNLITLTQFAKMTSDWDILVALSQTCGFDLFVSGTSLYFQPGVLTNEIPQIIMYSSLTDLQMTRLPAIASGVDLTVRSWNSAHQLAVEHTVDIGVQTEPIGNSISPIRKYTVLKPNLSADSAQALAQRVAQSISDEAMSIQFAMPGDIVFDLRRPITLQGSDTIFDRMYKVKSIIKSFRPDSGFTQVVRASLGA